VRYTECVDVCPAACFHLDDTMVYVDPLACVDCMACIVVCPVKAIFPESEVPEPSVNGSRSIARAPSIFRHTGQTETLPTAQNQRQELGF